MIVDIIIVLLCVSAIFRGREIGFVQQIFSTVGFFVGLIIGAVLQPHTTKLVQGQYSRLAITLITTLGMAFLLLLVAEYSGSRIKHRIKLRPLNRADNALGGILSILSVLIAVWLGASVIKSLPFIGLQTAVQQSKIVSSLNRHLPYAPNLIGSIGHLIDPNGFPEVFIGSEPNLPPHINLPPSSALLAGVNKDRASIVKIMGNGCGGVVDGSGFVVGSGLVVTNAHVVAGISRHYVIDANGTHRATAIWFDPNLDIAVLRTSNLAGEPLIRSNDIVTSQTPGAVVGYPGGGAFTADPAAVIEEFNALGRNIYGKGSSSRQVYAIAADVQPGNSGGPLILADGTVVGVVFARSPSQSQIGYALAMPNVNNAIDQAISRNTPVNTGTCAK